MELDKIDEIVKPLIWAAAFKTAQVIFHTHIVKTLDSLTQSRPLSRTQKN